MLIKGEFPIGLWVSPPPNEISNERYKEIREAGFNFVIGCYEHKEGIDCIRKALDCAYANNLLYLVTDPSVREIQLDDKINLYAKFDQFAHHPSYMGHNLYDEPSVQKMSYLSELKKVYESHISRGLAYVNLFPTYAGPEGLGVDDYDKYVEEFISGYKPKVISYDHYPFLKENCDSVNSITKDYFYNLNIISEKARKYNMPFWVFIQALAFNDTHRDPSEEEILWQVNMSLAFGASGIQYFTYWTPEDTVEEKFGDALIDRYGKKTRHYFEVQRINGEVKEIGKTLCNFKHVGVLTDEISGLQVSNRLSTFDPLVRIADGQAIAGCFEDDKGYKKILLVNLSFTKESKVVLCFSESKINKCAVLGQGFEAEHIINDKKNFVTVNLKPGEGKLLDLD